MRLHHPAPLAAVVLAAAMTGCGDATPPAKAGSTAAAAPTATAKDPSAARDKRNARHPDKTPKDIRQILNDMGLARAQEVDPGTGLYRRLTIGDIIPLLGQPVIPKTGPYAGACVFPNVCYDGHFVRSYLVNSKPSTNDGESESVLHNWATSDGPIEYIAPTSPMLQESGK